MANREELVASLQTRFRGIPNVTVEDCEGWIDRSLLEHNYRLGQDVRREDELLVLLYAEWDATLQIAIRTSHYFLYKDGDETVDKRMVSESYRKLADQLYKTYERKKNEIGRNGGPVWRAMPRADGY